MTDRYSVQATESGLLIAGPPVGFSLGDLFEMPTEPQPESKPQNLTAVAYKRIPEKARRRPVQRRIQDADA